MKKFLSIAIIVAICTIGITTKVSSETKIKVQAAMSMAGMGMAKSTSRNAAVYNILKAKYPKNVIAPSFVRMELELVNGRSEYIFDYRTATKKFDTEVKLDEQDAFRMTDVGFFLIKEDLAVPGCATLQAFANPFVFPDESGGLQTQHLNHLYNGKFAAKVGNIVYVPDMPVLDCEYVGTAQQTGAGNRSEKCAGAGFIPCTPQYTLKGRENNELKLIVPANSNQKVQTTAAGFKVRLVCILKGFKITGAGDTVVSTAE